MKRLIIIALIITSILLSGCLATLGGVRQADLDACGWVFQQKPWMFIR